LQVRQRTAKEHEIEAASAFAEYLDGINAVVQAVDAL
jgi:hypothetical protein